MKWGDINLWSAVSVLPPVILGLTGSLILGLEGHVLEMFLVLAMVGIHRYSAWLLNRSNLPADERADWMAVRVLTTVCCLAVPFYLALTIH